MNIFTKIGNAIVNAVKSTVTKVDPLRESLEDKLASVLRKASTFTSLDSYEEALIKTGVATAVKSASSGAVELDDNTLNTIATTVIEYKHKGESALATQLEKK